MRSDCRYDEVPCDHGKPKSQGSLPGQDATKGKKLLGVEQEL